MNIPAGDRIANPKELVSAIWIIHLVLGGTCQQGRLINLAQVYRSRFKIKVKIIRRQSAIIGVTTSGGYGHVVRKSLAFAYVNSGYESAGTTFDVRILGQRRKATVLAEAAWDPANERLKD